MPFLFRFLKRITPKQWRIIAVDLVMMWLLFLNLGLIVVDWVFAMPWPNSMLAEYLPRVHAWFNHWIHEPFILIDLGFVTVYALEFSIRWVGAIRNNTHHRWYFFPFVHWYDAVSLIPIGELRFLRMLRIISILVRLQKLQIIDLTKTYLFSQLKWYFSIFTEEVSDRVVIHVIEGLQHEIRSGSPVTDRILESVLLPQQEAITTWLSHRINQATEEAHLRHRETHEQFLKDLIRDAVHENAELKRLHLIPVVGTVLSHEIKGAIVDITHKVVDGYIQGLGSKDYDVFIRNYTDTVFANLLKAEDDHRLDEIVKHTVDASLELIKEEVSVQKWKLEDLPDEARKAAEKDVGA